MLRVIIQHSAELVAFIQALDLALYKPQKRHLLHIMDALLMHSNRKTLSALYRLLARVPGPKAAADFFRESPWQVEAISKPRQRFMLHKLLAFAQQIGLASAIYVSIDDSLGKKGKATRHLEAVAYHHNHNESSRKKQAYTNGYVYVEVHLQIGPLGFLFDTRLYLREKTVRRLNRKRSPENRLHYHSKYHLAREMLVELAEMLPKGYHVYVLFDSWYASAKLIKFSRRQHWHVISAIKRNRRIDQKRIDQHNQALRHKPYQRVTLEAADAAHKTRTYLVRTVNGAMADGVGEVRALISKRHKRDKRPRYFICTDLRLSAVEILKIYQKRWPVEVDNFYLKQALGLGDFRLQSFEATEKWFAVVTLALNYLQYQHAQAYLQGQTSASLADSIRQHRLGHFRTLLRTVIAEALRTGQVDAAVDNILVATEWAIV